ncbi:IS66 family transposase [Segatella copri]|uniref:IS66 family transposase n=1 Tax=Segatella copri TaxID=165179 RepID=A0AAW5UZ22_9BACT|nr:IS66 family transposase [Segatella copri]MCW4141942.1 IS66 family transposase [Segatella copri]MCW4147857.1 IS66 family transposase [Segatella copri]MCW4166606.1 IS66 family transposase [Segatella copri]
MVPITPLRLVPIQRYRHQPFNRQIKKMKQDGLILAPSTVDDWHQGVCDKIEPLYNLQKDRVMSSLLLGADV